MPHIRINTDECCNQAYSICGIQIKEKHYISLAVDCRIMFTVEAAV
jgi:hypothetical protein